MLLLSDADSVEMVLDDDASSSKKRANGNALIVNIEGHLDPLLMYLRRLFVDCKSPSADADDDFTMLQEGVAVVSYPYGHAIVTTFLRVSKELGNERFMELLGNLNVSNP